MVAAANYVVVAADSSKIGREDFVSFAPISSVDTLITDSEINDADRDQLTEQRRRGGGRMIVTVTPNPSIDRTVTLTAPLTRGAVHRVPSVTSEPGGKGVNVARALTLAGLDAVAVLPAPATDPLVAALQPTPCRSGACRSPGRSGPTSPSPNPTAPQRNSTSPAPPSMPPRSTRSPGRWPRAPSPRRGWCCPGRCRPVCRTAGTPTSSRCSRRYPCRVAVDTSEGPLAALVAPSTGPPPT